jgi:hypothetical protein
MMRKCTGYFFNDISQLNFNDIFKTFTENSGNLLKILKENRENIKKRYGSTDIINDVYELYKNYS